MAELFPIFVDYGLPGLAVAYLIWVNRQLQARNDVLTDKLIDARMADAERDSQAAVRDTRLTALIDRILRAVEEPK